ncbi:hypothetical protein [Myxococcus stipitatus]|uniref:hypothetical protein n=1 Tax=Myxococcus stipitatus TaxID=83455 RepID=UPI0022780DEC|nr:hypothetical protein [Myxococcus stipitatus]
MNKKLCVLGVVLGTVSGLAPGGFRPWDEPRVAAGVSGEATLRWVAPPPPAPGVEASGEVGMEGSEGPHHPCRLATVAKVPCDETREVCEYTYWECPRGAHPPRA